MSAMPPKAEVSYPVATEPPERNTMTEISTIDGPAVAQAGLSTAIPKARHRQRIELALHLDCSRTYLGKLEAEGLIQRQGNGFPLDQSRVAYLRFLRREKRQSPRSGG